MNDIIKKKYQGVPLLQQVYRKHHYFDNGVLHCLRGTVNLLSAKVHVTDMILFHTAFYSPTPFAVELGLHQQDLVGLHSNLAFECHHHCTLPVRGYMSNNINSQNDESVQKVICRAL